MSAIYQNEVIELTSSDLKTLEQELNPADDFHSLIIAESSFDKPLEAHDDDFYSELEDYMLNLEKRWEEPVKPLSEDEEQAWLQYENERLESDIEEQNENQYL